MTYKVEYLPIAQKDMVEIAKYIGVNLSNPQSAERLADKMVSEIEKLSEMPYRYPAYLPIRSLNREYRKLIIDNYTIFYCVDENTKIVTIARAIYSKRNYGELLK